MKKKNRLARIGSGLFVDNMKCGGRDRLRCFIHLRCLVLPNPEVQLLFTETSFSYV